MNQLFQGLIALLAFLLFVLIIFLMIGKDSDFSKTTLSKYAPNIKYKG